MNRWLRAWKAFCLAVQFLTLWPVKGAVGSTGNDSEAIPAVELQGQSLLWYPVVGLLLGGLLTLLTAGLPVPSYLTAAIVVAVWVLFTGGLHLDGLADSADAWLGGLGDRDKTLRIMKDPSCGAMGVLSLVLLLLLKTAALAAVIFSNHWIWLWAVPLLSRLSLLLLFLTTPYVRPQGLGEVLAQYFPKSSAWGVIVGVGVITLLVLPLMLWLLWLLVVLLVFGTVRHASLKRLQGFTGDVAGAQVELVEVALLVAVCFVNLG